MYGRFRLVQVVRSLASPLVSLVALVLLLVGLLGASSSSLGSSLATPSSLPTWGPQLAPITDSIGFLALQPPLLPPDPTATTFLGMDEELLLHRLRHAEIKSVHFSRGGSSLVLRMTREEIGSYLGLKLETVSRTFSKFQDDGILEVRQRQITVLNPAALQSLVNGATC